MSRKATVSGLMVHPFWGLLFLIGALMTIYYGVSNVVARKVVGLTEEALMHGVYEPAIKAFLSQFISAKSTPGLYLIGEFGLLTTTVTYLIGLLLPLVVTFCLIISIIEESYYLPRLAALVNRLMNLLGLNVQRITPLTLGPGPIQVGVVAVLLAPLGMFWVTVYGFSIVGSFAIIGTFLYHFLPDRSSEIPIDLPLVQWPRLGTVIKKTIIKSFMFLKEAIPLFALGAVLITTLEITGSNEIVQALLAPLTVGWLDLPREGATFLLLGLVRRDLGAAAITSMSLTPLQTVVSMITITLFIPSITSIWTLYKEYGWKESVLLSLGSWAAAFLVGGFIATLFG